MFNIKIKTHLYQNACYAICNLFNEQVSRLDRRPWPHIATSCLHRRPNPDGQAESGRFPKNNSRIYRTHQLYASRRQGREFYLFRAYADAPISLDFPMKIFLSYRLYWLANTQQNVVFIISLFFTMSMAADFVWRAEWFSVDHFPGFCTISKIYLASNTLLW